MYFPIEKTIIKRSSVRSYENKNYLIAIKKNLWIILAL